MKKKKNNVLIDILKFGVSKLEENRDFKERDLKVYLESKGYSTDFVDYAIDTFMPENFEELADKGWRINSQGYFNVLDHQNYKVAKSGLGIARLIGIASIVLSILSIILSYKALLQTNTVSLSEKQFKELKSELNRNAEATEKLFKTDALPESKQQPKRLPSGHPTSE